MTNQTEETISMQPLSVGWLTDFLRSDKGLKGDDKLPNAQAISTLSEKLIGIRKANQLQRDIFKPATDRNLGMRTAAQTLMAGLPKLRAELNETLNDDTFPSEFIEQEIEAIDKVLGELTTLLRGFSLNDRPGGIGKDFEKWKTLAPLLSEEFRKAMKSTNPSFEGYHGAIPRFLEAIIPEITGKDPKESSIREHVKKIPRPAQ